MSPNTDDNYAYEEQLDYSGAFLSPRAEKEYRLAHWDDFSHQWRVYLLTAAAVFVVAGITDFMALGFSVAGLLSFGGRVLIFLMVFCAGRLTLRTQNIGLFEGLAFTIEMLLIAHTLLSAAVKADGLLYHIAPVLLLTTAFYLFVPNRLILTVLAGFAMSVGLLVLIMTVYPTAPRGILSFSLIMLAINLFGIFEVKRTNQLRRKEYLEARKLEEEINKRKGAEMGLEALVANRTLELEEAKESLQRILDNSPVGLGISRIKDGRIIYGNSHLADIFGLKEEELAGFESKNIWRNPADRERFVSVFREKGYVPQQKALGQRVDGSPFWGLISWHSYIHDGDESILFWVVDIDDLKQTEIQLEKAKAEAEAANAAKTEFLARVSHELRTPLNSIIGLSEMLYDDAVEEKNTAFIDPLSRVNRAGQHLSSVINNILDLAKIEAGRMEFVWEELSLAVLQDQLKEVLSPLIESQSNRLIIDISTSCQSIVSDPVHLKQVLINLLGNANKFTEQGTITLRVVLKEGHPVDRMVFSIEDTGRGIPQKRLSDLFEAFTQAAPSGQGKKGGTGLGLAISKKIVESMGGKIGVESKEGIGSTFWFELPIKPENYSPDGT